MRITGIRAVHPRTPDEPGDWRTTVGQILVEVQTDSGIAGYGVGGGGPAGIYVIDAVLKPLLLDEDPHHAEALWARMFSATRAFGRVGLVMMAISGVDLALWDAWAKAEGLSVAALLAQLDGLPGVRTSHLPAYATTPGPIEAVALGYRSVKLHFSRGPEASIDRAMAEAAAVRRAIGPDIELFADAWERWDFDSALRATAALHDLGVRWLEEPLPTEERAAYTALLRQSPIAIAGGEHEYTARAFREIAEQQAMNLWQPDATWVGGMTELRKIYRIAAETGNRVVPHRGGEVWGLHAIAALDSQPLAESPRPWISWLDGQPAIAAGYVDLPAEPGFGVRPAREAAALLA